MSDEDEWVRTHNLTLRNAARSVLETMLRQGISPNNTGLIILAEAVTNSYFEAESPFRRGTARAMVRDRARRAWLALNGEL